MPGRIELARIQRFFRALKFGNVTGNSHDANHAAGGIATNIFGRMQIPHTTGVSARLFKYFGNACRHDLAVFFHDVPGMLYGKKGAIIFTNDLFALLPTDSAAAGFTNTYRPSRSFM